MKGNVKMVTSLRRYYPDQVLRVFLSPPPMAESTPGTLLLLFEARQRYRINYFLFVTFLRYSRNS
jgi:hypothetical protein